MRNELEMNLGRSIEFDRNEHLESTLAVLNSFIEQPYKGNLVKPKDPVLLLMGCPRSGSTLFMQWISTLGCFGYPSNLIARFYGNPWVGVMIQKILVDYDAGNQIGLNNQKKEYISHLGKTNGALLPSEFWYFWRRFFQFGEIQVLTDEQLNEVQSDKFLSELGMMEVEIGMPLVMKGMIMNWHIPYLAELFDKFIFLHLKRDLFFVAQSMYLARKKFFGTVDRWWSYKPVEYDHVKDLSPIEQVAAQAVYTENAVSKGMKTLDEDRKIEFEYSYLCKNPSRVFAHIRNKYLKFGLRLSEEYKGEKSFRINNKIHLCESDECKLRNAIDYFAKDISL